MLLKKLLTPKTNWTFSTQKLENLRKLDDFINLQQNSYP